MSGVRCFVGIALPDDLRDRLVEARNAICEADPSWRDEKWVARDNLHVTLNFLGSVPQADLEPVVDALSGAFSRAEPFDLAFDGIAAIPAPRRAAMLWASFADGSRGFGRCVRLVDASVLDLAIESETREPRAHATLARARRPHAVDSSALEVATRIVGPATSVSVASATLFSSRQTSSGPSYETIASWRFGAE
jgi:2'-5' RNA ligase